MFEPLISRTPDSMKAKLEDDASIVIVSVTCVRERPEFLSNRRVSSERLMLRSGSEIRSGEGNFVSKKPSRMRCRVLPYGILDFRP